MTPRGTAIDQVIGRERDFDRVERLLDSGGALLVEGEAGIGKTTLLSAALASARRRGFCVLAAAPAEPERTFSYAVLDDLLGSHAREASAELPGVQRRALDHALLVGSEDTVVEPRVVAVAVRNVLLALAAPRPLVVSIDDVQWADSASALALGFALRRLPGVPLRVLLAARTGHAVPLQMVADRVELGPLSVTALHRVLVERLGVAWSPSRLRRLHEVSGGNPFYALEIARANSSADRFALPESLRATTSDRIRRLPRATRRSLAVLALAGSLPSDEGLRAAERAGIIRRVRDTPRFAHPLLAEAAVSLLEPHERRGLHLEIAGLAVSPEVRARHLALAAEGPDEEVATVLAEAAEAALRRGAPTVAAELWELAARLTPEALTVASHERNVRAGIAHTMAGDVELGSRMLEGHLEALPRGPLRDAGRAQRALQLAHEDVAATIPALEQALVEAEDGRSRYLILRALAALSYVRGNAGEAAELVRTHLPRFEVEEESLRAGALALSAHFEHECDRPAWALVERALSLTSTDETEVWISPRRELARGLLRVGRLDEAAAALNEAFVSAEQHGHEIWRASLLSTRAEIELAAGRWSAALAATDEMISAAEQLGAPYIVSWALSFHGTAFGLLGRHAIARDELARAIDLAERHHAFNLATTARFAMGLLELSLGRTESAAAVYRDVPSSGWRQWTRLAGGRAVVDAIGTFASLGDIRRARDLLTTLPSDAREGRLAEAHLAAATGELDKAIDIFRQLEPSPFPLQHARELLLLGALQRRARLRAVARMTLVAAVTEFETIAAPLWAARAQDELGRLSGRVRHGNELSKSERRVAELVASGLSNKQVASELTIAVRTVEAHLSRTYSKLGVTSRGALAARWASHHRPQAGHPDP